MSRPDDSSDAQNTSPNTRNPAKARPDADVAVALAYNPRGDHAPRVIAKGGGPVAQSIIDIARANGIAIEKNADLATLLQAVDLDKEIPAEAFTAVAEILGYLYRANGKLAEVAAVRAEEDPS
ncbi:MAG TPA: EscU/YscU/HrcU family type III secretion system export apparatus switch protein [Alphaproteobacteria bacterium]|nr:EscU/YscU/HrcU family type III secretion system export apparatus switch protein [Alphaproteobacteria bacterium]